MAIYILLKIEMMKFLKKLYIGLIVKNELFEIEISNDINFFLIIIYILI